MKHRLAVVLLLASLLASAELIASLRAGGHPARAAADGWTAEYFAGIEPGDTPIVTRDEGDSLDRTFDGAAEPAPGVPAQNFSVRWTWSRTFDDAGLYRFEATTDDGMRIRLDGDTILDEWYDQPPATYVVERDIDAGVHEIEVEYYNNYYEGVARLTIDLGASPTPQPTDTPAGEPIPDPDHPPETVREPTATPVQIAPTAAPAVPPTPLPVEPPSPTATSPAATPLGLAPPRIECGWALPDMDAKLAGIQYESGAADRDPAAVAAGEAQNDTRHDDDMAAVPDRDNDPADGMQTPCALAPDAGPAQPGGVRHAIQIVPNLEDTPEPRRASLWMAANQADGVDTIAAASWLVYRPDGSQLAVVTGARPGSCDALGRGYGPPGSMFEAAAHTGQVAPAAVEDGAQGLLSRCRAGQAALFAGEFALSVEEPCGEYRVVSVARSSGGAVATLTTSIDVLCVSALKIDFGSVDWGVVSAGNRKPVAGDTEFLLANGAVPTIRNIGNDGMGLKLRFSPMTSDSPGAIVEFDSCFGRSDAAMQCINPIQAGALISFDTAAERVLCANDLGRIDFAVHPARDLAPGVYRGMVTLIGFNVPGACAGARQLP